MLSPGHDSFSSLASPLSRAAESADRSGGGALLLASAQQRVECTRRRLPLRLLSSRLWTLADMGGATVATGAIARWIGFPTYIIFTYVLMVIVTHAIKGFSLHVCVCVFSIFMHGLPIFPPIWTWILKGRSRMMMMMMMGIISSQPQLISVDPGMHRQRLLGNVPSSEDLN